MHAQCTSASEKRNSKTLTVKSLKFTIARIEDGNTERRSRTGMKGSTVLVEDYVT